MGKRFRRVQHCKQGNKRAAQTPNTKTMKALRTEHNVALVRMTPAQPPIVSQTMLGTPLPHLVATSKQNKFNAAQKAATARVKCVNNEHGARQVGMLHGAAPFKAEAALAHKQSSSKFRAQQVGISDSRLAAAKETYVFVARTFQNVSKIPLHMKKCDMWNAEIFIVAYIDILTSKGHLDSTSM